MLEYSRSGLTPSGGSPARVEGLVDEAIGELVVLPADGRVGDRCRAGAPGAPPPGTARGSASFLTLYSPRICFTISSESETTSTSSTPQLDRLREAVDEAAVLGDVVRRDADRLALRREDGAVVGLEHVAERRRARVARARPRP